MDQDNEARLIPNTESASEPVLEDDYDIDADVPKQAPESISFFTFFRYMTATDKLLFGIGTISAMIAGIILPSIAIVMATVAAGFTEGFSDN